MSALDDRIAVMKETGIISHKTVESIYAIKDMLKVTYGIELTEENAAPFITHITLAFERILRGEEIDALSDAVLEEVTSSDDYPFALKITDSIFELNLSHIALPESERLCVIIHFINVLCNIRRQYDEEHFENKA